ncbi:MAG TPA: hypothetical protein VLB10_07800 [Gammaproteobacteria bacterium]|jgi:hypothetical protein|nr:hypothetical protein [Gammaproteobacteria bacterium]
MKLLLTLFALLAGLVSQPLFAGIQPLAADTVMAQEAGGDGGKPPTEEEPDCE